VCVVCVCMRVYARDCVCVCARVCLYERSCVHTSRYVNVCLSAFVYYVACDSHVLITGRALFSVKEKVHVRRLAIF
jgi:hypothetical protein